MSTVEKSSAIIQAYMGFAKKLRSSKKHQQLSITQTFAASDITQRVCKSTSKTVTPAWMIKLLKMTGVSDGK